MTRIALSALVLAISLAGSPTARADDDEKKAPAKSGPALAEVKISGDLGDRRAPEMPFGKPPLTYRGLLEILKKAGSDPAIQGVLIVPGDVELGAAKLQGIREALQKLRQAGKKIYVYAESLDTPEALMASLADRIAMPESGVVSLPGVGAEVLYLKGLFGLLGIDWFVVQEKEYKTAFESFVRDGMSKEQREVLGGIIDQRYDMIVDAISSGRRIPADKVRQAIDEAILVPERARELGLIDGVEYRDQFDEALKNELGGELAFHHDYGRESREIDVSNPFALFAQVLKMLSASERKSSDPTPKLAIVYAEGAITSGKSQSSPFGGGGIVGSETLVKAIDEAAADASIKAIVLRIDSPGGSGLASDMIWRALMRAREKKPVVASMSDVAASGGYYIAMAAHVIVAEPTTITGSIGVIAARPSLDRLLGFWGVKAERIARGRNAGLNDLLNEPSDSEKETLTAFVAGFYEKFVDKVAKSRGMDRGHVEKSAHGRVWTGAQAKERGLVDELGGLERAMEIARKRAGLPDGADLRVVEYPEAPSFLESLSESFEARAAAGAWAATLSGVLGAGSPSGGPRPGPGALLGLPGGRSLLGRLWQIRFLCGERALAILPFEIEVR
jgi:protease IV